MTNRKPAEVFHPGEFIRQELVVGGWTRVGFAEECGMPVNWIDRLIEGWLDVTPQIAVKLAAVLDTSEGFWLKLQEAYDAG